jgi:hypothetical protein
MLIHTDESLSMIHPITDLTIDASQAEKLTFETFVTAMVEIIQVEII